MPKVGGKEYKYRDATLESLRQCAKIEREISAIDADKMLDDDKIFHHLVSRWSAMLEIMLDGGAEIRAGAIPAHELMTVKKGFFDQGTPTK